MKITYRSLKRKEVQDVGKEVKVERLDDVLYNGRKVAIQVIQWVVGLLNARTHTHTHTHNTHSKCIGVCRRCREGREEIN